MRDLVSNNLTFINPKQKEERKQRGQPEHEILKQAKKDIANWFDYFSENIDRFRDDIYFTFVCQWDTGAVRDRNRKSKSVLEFNRLYTHITQVLGEQRQNTPNFKVRASFKDASQEEVNIRDGILRSTVYKSRADIAFQTCFRSQLCGGFGAIQLDIDYDGEYSFDLEPRIYSVPEPTICFWDPMAKESDKSDGRFCGKYTTISHDEFKRRYPKVEYYQSFPRYTGSSWTGWGDEKYITIADYYCKEYYTETIYKLSDGRILNKKEAEIASAKAAKSATDTKKK